MRIKATKIADAGMHRKRRVFSRKNIIEIKLRRYGIGTRNKNELCIRIITLNIRLEDFVVIRMHREQFGLSRDEAKYGKEMRLESFVNPESSKKYKFFSLHNHSIFRIH